MDNDAGYLRRAGATFRWLINDLKRNEHAAADELGVDVSLVRAIVAGKQAMPPNVLDRAVKIWPLNERDLSPIHDDLPRGVHVMRNADSKRSSRVISRGGEPYYEYRDTAMTRLTSLRPEWIKLLRTVDDVDPENPAVVWNRGHFLYQFTFFFGECNYYYEWGGRKYCIPVATGDSVFGLPFVRHSFASRDPNALGHILALTFGGRLGGDVRQELAALGTQVALLTANQAQSQGALLALHAANGAYTTHFLAAESGIAFERLERAVRDDEALNGDDLQRLADVMRIPIRELTTSRTDTEKGIVLVRANDARTWYLPDQGSARYRLTELAGSRVTPHTKSVMLEILDGSPLPQPLSTGLYQYGYNHGRVPVILRWVFAGEEHAETFEPDDSFVMKSHVPHWFEKLKHPSAEESPRVLLLRAGGRITGDAVIEAAMIGQELMRRVVEEIGCWYDEA